MFNRILFLVFDSILNLPVNEEVLNVEFGKFGYQILLREQRSIILLNPIEKDTIELELRTYLINGNRTVVRGIGYFKSK